MREKGRKKANRIKKTPIKSRRKSIPAKRRKEPAKQRDEVLSKKIVEKKKKVTVLKRQEKKTLLLYCPRCKRETDNTITGFIGQKIRRVRCEVCKSEYNYHRILAMKKRVEEGSDSGSSESSVSVSQQNYYRIWEDLMLGRDPATARAYNIKDKYFENDLINHTIFGIGVVRSVKEDYKIEVVFKNGIKILAHNRFMTSQ